MAPDPKQRIVVDAVEFGTVFRFPRILRAVTAAMQPPRLVIALLMVVNLTAIGRTWDGLAEPSYRPGGVLAGPMDAAEHAGAQELFWTLLGKYDVEAPGPRDQLDARNVRALLRERFRVLAAAPTADDADDATAQSRADRFAEDAARVDAFTPRGVFESLVAQVADCRNRAVRGVVDLRPGLAYRAAADLLVGVPRALWRHDRTFTIAYGLIFLVVMAIGGGAISRMAAVEIGGHERLGVRAAFDYALSRWPKLILAPVLPLLTAGVVALALVAFGVLFAPWLDIAGGVLYGGAVVVGFLLAFLLLGYAVAAPLLVPAVACENCDAGDALQRAYAYALARPVHLAGYAIVTLAGFAVGYLVVAAVAATVLNATATLTGVIFDNAALADAGGFGVFDFGLRTSPVAPGSWHESAAAACVSFWQRVVINLVAAYLVAYFFSATTAVYLFMRQACDGQDPEEIWHERD